MQYPTYIKSVKSRRKRHYFRVIVIAAALVYAIVAANGIKNDMFGGTGGSEVAVEIPEGASAGMIADVLKEKGVIKHPLLFRLAVKFSGGGGDFQMGQHTLDDEMSYREIMEAVTKPSVPSNAVTVTITEGSEIGQTAEKLYRAFLEKGLEFSKEVFLRECDGGVFDFPFVSDIKRNENRLEGYLFPATYTFSGKVTEHDVISAMLKKFSEEYTAEFEARARELGFTTDDVVTLASVVEREGASVPEFKTVSSVFHNRLNKKMKLESCATVQYVLGERKEILSVADTKTKSPYNTYMNFGLPVGPIASPGRAAIEAALYPSETDYLYFVLRDGKHIFSKTYREHQQVMKVGI